MDKKLDQQLDKQLQQSYQQLSAKAPEGLWEQLQAQLPEGELDQQLDNALQASYEQVVAIAPVSVWEQLEQLLPIEALDQQLDDTVQASYEKVVATAPVGIWEQVEQALPVAALDQQLDDKLKEGFAQKTLLAAPVALWSVISEELETTSTIDEQLDGKIKKSFREDPLKAPQKVWAAVNRQLNIDRTWQKISTALDAPVSVFDWKLRSLQGLIIALLLLLGVRTCNKVPTTIVRPTPVAVNKGQQAAAKTNSTKLAEQLTQQEAVTLAEENTIAKDISVGLITTEPTTVPAYTNTTPVITGANKLKRSLTTNKKQQTATSVPFLFINKEHKEAQLVETIGAPTKGKKPVALILQKQSEPILPLDIVEEQKNKEGQQESTQQATQRGNVVENKEGISRNLLSTISLSAFTLPPIQLPDALELVNEPKWKSNHWTLKNRLAVGVFTAVNSTVLLNNETREGFDGNSLTINYFGLAANYGLWARYRLNKKGALMAEYSINADHRQAYGSYEKGKFILKEYVFKYNRVSLAYQLDLWKNKKGVNNKVTGQLGVYAGAMRAARVYYDKVLVNDRLGEYHYYDGGIKVAFGHEVVIDQFVLGYGLRSDIGITNIFKGNQRLKGQQDKTNLIHLGAYIHLGYQF